MKRNTGGSTGEPLEFFSDLGASYKDNAHHWYLYHKMGYQSGDIIVSCGGIHIAKEKRKNNIYWIKRSKDYIWGEYAFSALYINEDNIQYYIEKLLELKPAILRGLPSFFDKLAQYMIKNSIVMDFQIKGVNLTGEMCSDTQRVNIEKAFSSQVYFEYGHTEICLYCYTDSNEYIYKSSPIYGYIEVLGEDGRDVNIGEIGKIVVTGFNNKGMPFIRYDTGDMGKICYRNGGIVHFSKIYGRKQDYIIAKNNEKVLLTSLIFGQHLKAFKNISQWQMVQKEVGKVKVYIVKGKDYTEVDEQELIVKLTEITGIELEFVYVSNIALTNRGKQLFFIQNLKLEN
jgi:phenylacetate-CoA ligase